MAGLSEQQSLLLDAFQDVVERNDRDGLLAILRSPEGEAAPNWVWEIYVPGASGPLACLRVLHERGVVLYSSTWEEAAGNGHLNCLEFAVSHGYKLEDSVLTPAVYGGHLACVEFLLQLGLPRKPYVFSLPRTRASQLQCIQFLLDKKVAVGSRTLVSAACQGDVDIVRWLHQRGVPLWRDARDATWHARQPYPDGPVFLWGSVRDGRELPGAITIPSDPPALEKVWRALRYGVAFGAPVTQRAVAVFAEKRQRTHAVLRCFKAAARLYKGPGRAQQRRVWAGMAALPSDLVEELLILADLEIPESIMRCLPLHGPAIAQ